MSRITTGIPRVRPGFIAVAVTVGFHVMLSAAFSVSATLGFTSIVLFSALVGKVLKQKTSEQDVVLEERQKLIDCAQSEPSLVAENDFLLSADCLGNTTNRKELYNIFYRHLRIDKTAGRKLQEHSQNVAKLLEDSPGDLLVRFEIVCEYIGSLVYEEGQSDLYQFLTTGKGNCEAKAKLFLSLLHLVYGTVPEGSNWTPALATYHKHVDLVLFNQETKEVFDPIYEREGEHPAAIYRTELFYHGYLRGMGVKTEKEANDYILKSPFPFNTKEGAANGSITNSIFDFGIKMPLPYFNRGEDDSFISEFSFDQDWPAGRYYEHPLTAELRRLGLVAIGTVALFYAVKYGIDKTYKVYQHYGLCEEACATSLRKIDDIRFAPFKPRDITECNREGKPLSFWDSLDTTWQRRRALEKKLVKKLRDGHKRIYKITKRLEDLDPKAVIEFQSATKTYIDVQEAYVEDLIKLGAELPFNDTGPYTRADTSFDVAMNDFFKTVKGARRLNELSADELVKFVESLSRTGLIQGLMDIEGLRFGFALNTEGRNKGKKKKDSLGFDDDDNVVGDHGQDSKTKRGENYSKTVKLQNSKSGERVLRGDEEKKDDKAQSGNHANGNASRLPPEPPHDLPKTNKHHEFDVEIVELRPELNQRRTAPDQKSKKKTEQAPPVAFVPWTFLPRLTDAVETAYPKDGKSLTYLLKKKLIDSPEARDSLREQGVNVNRYKKDVERGGFGLPPNEGEG